MHILILLSPNSSCAHLSIFIFCCKSVFLNELCQLRYLLWYPSSPHLHVGFFRSSQIISFLITSVIVCFLWNYIKGFRLVLFLLYLQYKMMLVRPQLA